MFQMEMKGMDKSQRCNSSSTVVSPMARRSQDLDSLDGAVKTNVSRPPIRPRVHPQFRFTPKPRPPFHPQAASTFRLGFRPSILP